ncbi:hypothetical protein BY996DRAFT_2025687 [Phakopsora pachyrhizi]|nr:hypothetical protein BY996DRAFT_2025687 [Phakopsora pachyrhizi]
MAEIAEIVKEVKNKKFIRIARMDREEDCEILDKKLSQSLEEASVKYREIMNLSNENRGVGKNKASAFDQIEETLGNRRDEDIAEEVRDKEILNELLKVKDTIQSATKYLLEQEIVRRKDISKTLEAMSNHFYDEAWFQKNIFDRSRREEDFDPFFSSIDIKEYIYNHPSIEQHRILLKALNQKKLRSSILKFLLSYSELIFSHYGDQMSSLEKSSINKILTDLIEGKSIHNNVWESAFSGTVSDATHYNRRMIYHLILYHAYGFNYPEDGLNMASIWERMWDFKYVLCIQQRILNFYRSKRFMGYELKITTPYKKYMDEINMMRLKNHGLKTTVVDNFNQLKIKVSEVGFQKSVLARNLAEWHKSVDRAHWGVIMHLNKEKTDFYIVEIIKYSHKNLQWENSEIIRLTKLYNKSYIRSAEVSLELSISNWLKEIENEISEPKTKTLSQKIYSGLFSY